MAKTKQSLKERMKNKREAIKKRGGGGGSVIYVKEGTIRVRPLFVGSETDFLYEATYFYFGKGIGGFISPKTFGEPCPAYELYEKLKNGSEQDKEDAKKIVPKTKFFMAVAKYEDTKGAKLDEKDSGKLVLLTNGLAQDIIDLFLDEDEWGDPTDLDNGYDLKIQRNGTGMTDTEYSVNPTQKRPLKAKDFRKTFDLEAMVREATPSFEEIEQKVAEFMGDAGDEDEDDAPKKSSKKSSSKTSGKKVSKKRRTSDS
jgi:hypothetical protein